MLRKQFWYQLPPELIAQRPLAKRSASRLLVFERCSGRLSDAYFWQLSDWLRPGDLLVFNDTKVLPARLYGRKASGGKVEILIERVMDESQALVHIRASRAPRVGGELHFDAGFSASVMARSGELYRLQFNTGLALSELLSRYGQVPLPPYIDRSSDTDDTDDSERYQTVYARNPGAVAAPTAGFHFDHALLQQLTDAGIGQAFLTLHVGAATFQPVRSERLDEHRMHSERVSVSAELCRRIRQVKANAGRVIAVGTTVVRSLETASLSGELQPFSGETQLFITPGFQFRCTDAMITNFHLPESTLLMLIAAFAGYDQMMNAYRHAIRQRYRFYSFGDAMLIINKLQD